MNTWLSTSRYTRTSYSYLPRTYRYVRHTKYRIQTYTMAEATWQYPNTNTYVGIMAIPEYKYQIPTLVPNRYLYTLRNNTYIHLISYHYYLLPIPHIQSYLTSKYRYQLPNTPVLSGRYSPSRYVYIYHIYKYIMGIRRCLINYSECLINTIWQT